MEATIVLVGVCKCKLCSHIHVLDQILALAELIVGEVHSKFSRIYTIGKIFFMMFKRPRLRLLKGGYNYSLVTEFSCICTVKNNNVQFSLCSQTKGHFMHSCTLYIAIASACVAELLTSTTGISHSGSIINMLYTV